MKDDDQFLRKQAWDYFALHASQRITTFNFYLLLSSLMSTTYFSSFKTDSNLQSARPFIAVLLICFSIVFWKLDKRNRYLIKNAEAALMVFEAGHETENPKTKLFTLETNANQPPINLRHPIKSIVERDFSYSNCFNLVFLGFGAIGASELIRILYTACIKVLPAC